MTCRASQRVSPPAEQHHRVAGVAVAPLVIEPLPASGRAAAVAAAIAPIAVRLPLLLRAAVADIVLVLLRLLPERHQVARILVVGPKVFVDFERGLAEKSRILRTLLVDPGPWHAVVRLLRPGHDDEMRTLLPVQARLPGCR